MHKQLIVLSLIAAPGLIAQETAEIKTEQSGCNTCCCTPCCCVPKPKKCIDCECYTPDFYDLQCDWGVLFDVEFLYWYARETNLAYAVKFTMLPEIDPPTVFTPIPSQVAFPTDYKHIKAEWDPGVRVGIGWNSGCDGWDYYLNWTYFHNKASSSTEAEFDGSTPVAAEQGVLDLWENSAFFDAPIYDKVSAKWRITFNQIDLELGRKYWLSPCFNLRPYAGLRGAWTRTRFNVTGKLGPKDINGTLTEETNKDRFKNRNWGAGFLVGLQPNWYFCSNFILYGNLDAALLWGEFEGRKKIQYINSLTLSDTTAPSFDVSNTSDEKFFSMNTLIDLAIGLRWEETWCCDRYRSALDLGWEHHIWFDHGVRHKPVERFTDGNFQYFKNTVDVVSNLVYGGLVVRLRFDF